jgi:hypothetical protein
VNTVARTIILKKELADLIQDYLDNPAKFDKYLRGIDKTLAHIPLHQRNAKIFYHLCKDYPSFEIASIELTNNLLSKIRMEIVDWYKIEYEALSLVSYGQMPVKVGDRLCSVEIIFFKDSDENKELETVRSYIQGLSKSDKINITQESLKAVKEKINIGLAYFINFYGKLYFRLEHRDFSERISNLALSADVDVSLALHSLTNMNIIAMNQSVVHAHQALEKYLKAYYLCHRAAEYREFIKGKTDTEVNLIKNFFGKQNLNVVHDIEKLSQLLSFDSSTISKCNIVQQICPQDLRERYNFGTITEDKAIEVIELMLMVCAKVVNDI